MSDGTAVRALMRWRRRSSTASRSTHAVDARRGLQLALAGLWLLDGVLQFQPFMFTTGFAHHVLAPAARGNPAIIAAPITAVARLVADHPAGANAAFATAQLLLGLAIAWRSTVKIALGASIVWALAVWWLGEGLGGVLTGHAGPVAGGPGAALLYALLAVLLWPPRDDAPPSRDPFVGAGAIGEKPAQLVWFVLWASLAGYAVDGTNRSAQGLHDLLAGMAAGQPAWLAAISNQTASVVAHRGLGVSIALAAVLAALAVAIFGPPTIVRTSIVVAAVVSAVIWVTAEALGGLFGGQGTDPNTGPLLIVFALTYWPFARPGPARET